MEKRKKKNIIFKGNKNTIINLSKSYSSTNKKKSFFDSPKSYEFKTSDNTNININNGIINNYINKKHELYTNKMAKIDKYLNDYFHDNNKKNPNYFNKKKICKINKNKNIDNNKKDYFTENSIFRTKNNKNIKNKGKISPSNIIYKNYYTSKGSYWTKNEINFNKDEKILIDKSPIHIQDKKLYKKKKINNNINIYNSPNTINYDFEKINKLIQPNNKAKNKITKNIINNKTNYSQAQESKQIDSNSLYKNISERNRIIPLNENKLMLLNRKIHNNFILEEKNIENEQNQRKEILIKSLYKHKKENNYLENNASIHKNKNRNIKTKQIPYTKKDNNTISSNIDINKNKNEIQNYINNQNQIDGNTINSMNKYYINNFNNEEQIFHVNDNNIPSNNDKTLYEKNNNNINIDNNKNNYIHNRPIISYKYKSYNNELINNNKQNAYSELISKQHLNNICHIKYNSSFNIFNNESKIDKDQNISEIRKYLHNYYEIKSKNNLRKNNSHNNINSNYNQNNKINDNTLKNNLLKNLIKNEEKNNNYYNNLPSNVNININISPSEISNKNIDIKINNINGNKINSQNNKENNEYDPIEFLTPSFMKTKKELSNDDKNKIQKNMKNDFNYNYNMNNINEKNNDNKFFEQDKNIIRFSNYTFGYDYTFKNINSRNNNYINDLNKENKVNNKNYYKMEEKRKDDIIQLLNFSENLGLNYK